MAKIKVLFLCTGNSARSQMAEALLRKYAGDQFEVYSAGLEPEEIHPYTRRVMAEIGLDLAGHRSKSLREYLGYMHFGYLFTVCNLAEKNCPKTFLGVGLDQHSHWDFDDPAAFQGPQEETITRFRQVRNQIDQRIKGWLAEQRITV